MQTVMISGGSRANRDSKVTAITENLIGKASVHPDFYETKLSEDKNQISIDQVRELIKHINLKPIYGKHRIALIAEAQKLSLEAQNALLKVIEEPPEYAQIILTVDHCDNLLPTIVSRCKVKHLPLGLQVDVKTDLHKKFAHEMIKLLGLDMGERLDWIIENKSLMKDRGAVVEMLKSWEIVMRDIVVLSVDADVDVIDNDIKKDLDRIAAKVDYKIWVDVVNRLRYIVGAIEMNNAKVPLGLEYFLVYLP